MITRALIFVVLAIALFAGASAWGRTPPTIKPGMVAPSTPAIENVQISENESELDFDDFLDTLDTNSVGSMPQDGRPLPSSAIQPSAPEPLPGIGIAPGDVVLGNIDTYPGHAGIFIGRWRDLPEYIQSRYSDVFSAVLIRSRDWGLVDSYLVVDSMGGRGVRLASFVEQFTGYLPTLSRTTYLDRAAQWESEHGGAVAWPGLGADDPRRWAIVEEALQAARARVPYDDSHLQWATVNLSGYADLPYENFSEGLDCIALVHTVYQRGAGIDLDTSWWPFHEPHMLYETALGRGMLRRTDLSHARFEALVQGRWRLTLQSLDVSANQPTSPHLRALLQVEPAIYALWADDESFYFSYPAFLPVDRDMWSETGWRPSLRENADGSATFTITTQDGGLTLTGHINASGQMRVEVRGTVREFNSPRAMDVGADGVPDGQFTLVFVGEKVKDIPGLAQRNGSLAIRAQSF